MSKIGDFFKSFGKNVKADPVGSLVGLVYLAGGGLVSYGMASGQVPTDETHISLAGALTAGGIHKLGTDSTTGKTSAAADKLAGAVGEAAQLAPAALSIADHFKALKTQAGSAQATMSAVSDMAQALAAMAAVAPQAPANLPEAEIERMAADGPGAMVLLKPATTGADVAGLATRAQLLADQATASLEGAV